MLEKQIVPINIAQSPNQKIDPNTLSPGVLTSLKNAHYQKQNRIDKRYGHDQLTMQDRDSNTLTDIKGIIGTKKELIAWVGDSIYAYVPDDDVWIEKGDYIPAEFSVPFSLEYTGSIDNYDIGYGNSEIYVATRIQGGDLFLHVLELDGSVKAGPFTVASGSYNSPRFLTFNSGVYLFYREDGATNLFGRRIGPSYTNYLDTEQALVTDCKNLDQGFSVLNYNDTRIVLGYIDNSPDTTHYLRYYDSTLTELTGTYAVNTITGWTTGAVQIHLELSSSGSNIFVTHFDAFNVEFAVVDSTNSTTTTPTGVSITVGNIATYPLNDGTNDGIQLFAASTYLSTFQEGLVDQAHIADNGTVTAQDPYGFNLANQGRPFQYDSKWFHFMGSGYLNTEDGRSYNVNTGLDDGPHFSGVFLWGFASFNVFWQNVNVINPSSGVFYTLVATSETSTNDLGCVLVKIDFTSEKLFTGVQYGNAVVIAGSNLMHYDGQVVRELGFLQAPITPDLTGAISGGSIVDGTYSIVTVFEYLDANGLLHRSSPSTAASVTITGSGGSGQITVSVPGLHITNINKNSGQINQVKVAIYRTTTGSVYYREADTSANELISSYSPQNLSLVLRTSNSQLETREILYTNSGEVEPGVLPPFTYITTWQKRLWAAGSFKDEAVYYSKEFEENLAPEMSAAFKIITQEIPGSTTGIKGFSDKIVLAKKGRLHYSYGDGPNALGEGGTFAKFEEIIGVSGVVNGKSMVETRNGIWFKSEKGIYLLDQGLNVTYAGAVFEDEQDTAILKAVAPTDSDTLRFLTGSGVIEFNTFFRAWSLQTGITPLDAAIADDDYYILDSSNQVWKENRTVYKDGSTSYGLFMESGWTSLAGIAGFQRFYRFYLKCTYKSVHTLKVSLAYDFSSSYRDSVTFDPADAIDTDVYRFTVFPSLQKCESFRFKIEEIITDGTAGTHESFQLNFIGIQVGAKRGLPKLKDAQKVGVTTI